MSSRRFSLSSKPQHDLLAPQRGQGRDAEIELLLLAADLHLQHDAAVLRQPLFADVELGHDLEARGDGVLQLQRRIHDRLQDAVNAEADAEFFFVGLHVNVAGAALHRIGEDQVHELDDGGFVGRFLQFLQVQSPALRPAVRRRPPSPRSFIDCMTCSSSSSLEVP